MEKEKSNKKLSIILTVVIVALVAVIGVLAYMLLKPKQVEQPAATAAQAPAPAAMEYDSAAVVTEEDSIQKKYEEMAERAKEGTMALQMRTEAKSSDGENFTCTLANAENNRYDMFMVLYLDDTGEEIYRSGLIPVGSMIDQFKSSRKLEPGEYQATLVYNQVEEDRATIHSHVNVGITLKVQ